MQNVGSSPKVSVRILIIGLVLLLAGSLALAGNWKQVTELFSSSVAFSASAVEQPVIASPAPIGTGGTCNTAGPIEVESSGGTMTPTAYATLKDAFDAINAGTHTGSILIEVCGNTTETATAALNASGSGAASYTSVSMGPVGGTRIIEGSITGAIVKLTGADNVTIDGRLGGTGTTRDLTVRNNSTSASTAAIWLTSTGVGAGATNNTVRNLEIATGVTQNTSTSSSFGIIMASNNTSISTSSGGDDNDNNSFIANRIIRARYGIATRGQTTNNNESPIITDNIIGPDAFGADEIGKSGIFLQADNNALVSRNTVQFVGGCLLGQTCTSGTDRSGIAVGSESAGVTTSTTITSSNYTVTRNVVHDIVEERTFSSAGIILGTTRSGSPTNNVIANNFVYNIRSNGTSGDQVIGISITNGNTDTIAFNSIAITGDMDPTGATSSSNFGNGIRINTANGTNNANFTVVNNSIYMDASSDLATTHYYAITLNNNAYSFGTGALNYNNYYINTGNAQQFTGGLASASGTAAGTEFATLANWQGALTTPQDANSIQSDPLFLSVSSDLHLAGASPNIDAGTTVAGISDDIDGQVRPNGASVDIGADEFYPAPGVLQLSNTAYSANEGTTVGLTVNRASGSSGSVGVDLTLTDGTATGGAACTAGVDYINPGPQTLTFGDGVVTQTLNVTLCSDVDFEASEIFTGTLSNATGGATIGANGAATVTINNVAPPFAGTVNVGTGENYTSLTNPGGLFEAINNSGATANIVIEITSDLAGETGTVALNEVAGGFTVTIQPNGAPRVISGSTSANAIIRINGADNVTIDGALPPPPIADAVGGNPAIRNLTIQNTSTTATAAAVIAVTEGTNGANNVTIKNVNVLGQDPAQTLLGIHVGGNTIGASPTIASNNNSRIENCSIRKAILGIFNNGLTATPATGTVITQNDLSGTGTDRLRRAGIFFFNQDGIQVTENSVGGIETTESADAIGIIAGNQNVTTTVTTGGGVSNALIARNKVNGVVNNGTVGFSAAGIVVAGGTLGPNTIANNMITGVSAASTSPDLVAGIFVTSAGGSSTKVYYNSVAMTGERFVTGASSSQLPSYGIAYTADVALELKNNIFYTTQVSTGGGANAKSYAIGTLATTFANLDSNYNAYYSFGANDGGFRSGSLAGGAGTDYADLTAWQTATSQEANSQESDPAFIEPLNDLHLFPSTPVENDGTAIAGVTDDIDGDLRQSPPEIGADEFGDTIPPDTQILTNPTNPSNSADATFTFDGTDTGGSGVASFECRIDGGGFSACTSPKTYMGLSQGSHTFDVRAIDGAGNIDPTPASYSWVLDAIAPDTQILTNPPDPSNSADATFTFTATDMLSLVVTFECKLDAGSFTSCASPQNYMGLSDGSHTFSVRATDAAGNVDPTPATYTWTISTAPASPITVTATAGTPTGNYNTLTEAVTAINAGTHQGDIVVNVNQSVVEPGSVVINGSGAGSASYTSILIRPTANGLTVSGATVQGRGLIELNGADNVTIDGDNPNTLTEGGNPINRDLTLQNTAANTVTFTSVVRVAVAATGTNSADNNVIRNLNVLGSATGLNVSTATSTTTGGQNTTFGIFAGPGASTTDGTVAPSAVTSVSTGVGAGATVTNLTVQNNAVMSVGRGVSMNGSATSVFPGLQIRGNSIGNATSGAADQVYSIGITAQGSLDAVIADNSVHIEGYIASSSATHGINVGVNSTAVTGATIERNDIRRVQNNNGGTWSAFGINLGGGSSHVVRNNFVSGMINSQVAGTGGFGTTFGAYGIRISSGTGHVVYHNSVHLYGALPGVTSTDLTSAFVITSTTLTGIDVRNNLFSNQITGGNPTGTRHVAVYLPTGATSAMNLTWNNNGYYVGSDAQSRLAQRGTTFGTGEFLVGDFDPTQTTPATNFRSYTSTLSAAGTNDDSSFAVASAPPVTSNSDLHIPATTPTRLESGGAAVGVGFDIDAELRNATTPDVGADEFNGAPPPANDIAAVTLLTPANGSTIPTGSFSPQARFNNPGTATQTMVPVRFRIFDGMMVEIYNQTASIPSIAPNQNVDVTFPSALIASAGSYTMVATAENPGDTNSANDNVNGSFNTVVPLSGSVNVGTGEAYTSLTNAGGVFQALNLGGISGDLTVNITSDLTAETGAVMLNQLVESGAGGYTVTFRPLGAARTISGTSASSAGLITLNGADRIVFDGSLNALGGNDRSLTITNNQTSTTTVFWIRSQNASNGATNNTIRNCIINGAPGPLSTTTAGILTGSGTTLGNDAEAANSNNTIQNNWIYRVQNSLYLRGGATAPVFDQNWNVTGNELGSTVAADKNIFRGMLIGNSANFVVSDNTVHGVLSTTTTTASMSGIQLALLLSNGSVTNNVISDIKNQSASGTGAAGISIIATSTNSNVTIANNFVSDVAANGSATVSSNGHGISFLSTSAGSGYNVYFNSVNLATNQATAQTSAAMFVTSTFSATGAIDLRNNVLANNQTTGTRYAVYSAAPAAVFSTINYNDYFAQNVGFLTSARTTLGDWQTATGQDANSLAVDPLFVSASDLHLQTGSPMLAAGVAGTGITTDIDGDIRQTPPDIGADEIISVAVPGTLQFSSATYSGGESGSPFTVNVTRTNGSDGTVTVNFATSDGTATGGASCAPGIDYVNNSGTLTFLNGETSKTFDVTVCDDAVTEPDETINYTLSNATGGATIGTPGTAVQTIVDNDVLTYTVAVNDVRIHEGNTGTAFATFNVTLSSMNNVRNLGGTIASVQYATANGTATAGGDYLATSGTLNFDSTGTLTVSVPVLGETVKEANETFSLNLTNPSPNTTITDNQGIGIIIDEDRAYIADFDRDLKTDYSVFRPSEGNWYVLESASVKPNIVNFGLNGDIATPGDYDGDGLADIALWRPSEGKWYVIRSTDSAIQIFQWGTSGDKAVQGDYDGDAKTDYAIFRPSAGEWWISYAAGGSLTTNFGISTDRPVQGDYDGDSKTDLAVYRDGTWYVVNSSTATLQVANWGISTDKPVPSDFDGDGKFDFAVYRNGDWWIISSLTGGYDIVALGDASDIPAAGDFDGDGTSDPAVFRSSNGDWYVIPSTTSSLTGVHWGTNGDVPVPSAYLPQ